MGAANISVVRSLQNSLARRTAMTAGRSVVKLRAPSVVEDLEAISRSVNRCNCWKERLRR